MGANTNNGGGGQGGNQSIPSQDQLTLMTINFGGGPNDILANNDVTNGSWSYGTPTGNATINIESNGNLSVSVGGVVTSVTQNSGTSVSIGVALVSGNNVINITSGSSQYTLTINASGNGQGGNGTPIPSGDQLLTMTINYGGGPNDLLSNAGGPGYSDLSSNGPTGNATINITSNASLSVSTGGAVNSVTQNSSTSVTLDVTLVSGNNVITINSGNSQYTLTINASQGGGGNQGGNGSPIPSGDQLTAMTIDYGGGTNDLLSNAGGPGYSQLSASGPTGNNVIIDITSNGTLSVSTGGAVNSVTQNSSTSVTLDVTLVAGSNVITINSGNSQYTLTINASNNNQGGNGNPIPSQDQISSLTINSGEVLGGGNSAAYDQLAYSVPAGSYSLAVTSSGALISVTSGSVVSNISGNGTTSLTADLTIASGSNVITINSGSSSYTLTVTGT